jgi:hypothetical protein
MSKQRRMSLRLSRLPHELAQAGFRCDDLPPYRKLWEGAVERRFPAHQVNGVWHFFPEDVPRISAAYGLRLKNAVPASHAARSGSEGDARKVAL